MTKLIQFFVAVSMLAMFTVQADAAAKYKPGELDNVVHALYSANDFVELDKLATEFRQKKYRNSSGNWHLTIFYLALGDAMTAESRGSADDQWSKVESRLNRWTSTAPQSASAPIALAIAHQKRAWAYRGTGYSNTVTPTGWEGFNKHLALAQNTLMANKNISNNDPHWYALMLVIAYGQGWDAKRHRDLYEEATSKEPLYFHTYSTALVYFTPRWGGTMEKVHAFVEDAVKKTSSSEGKAMYARLYTDFVGFNDASFLNEPVIGLGYWTKTKDGYKDLLKHYPNEWNKNNYAKLGCLRGDLDVFLTMYRELGGTPMADAWPKDLFERCKEFVKRERPNSPI